MDRETAKAEIKRRPPDFLDKAKQRVNGRISYICPNPNCRNGSGQNGTGIALDPHNKDPHYKCFVCGLYEDIIGLWKLHTGVNDDTEAFNGLYEHYGIEVDEDREEQMLPKIQNQPKNEQYTDKDIHTDVYTKEMQNDNMSYYKDCQKHIGETDYPFRRGLSPELVAKYMLGYDAHFTKGTGGKEWKALIIPTGRSTYVARNTDPEAQKKDRYRKNGGNQIFNTKEAFGQDAQPVFIVEGEMDALSIVEVGGQAVGLGSTANYRRLLELLKKKKPDKPLILALDNDEEGLTTTERIIKGDLTQNVSGLEALGIPYISTDPHDLYGGEKDANALLVKDRGALKEGVNRAVAEALSQQEEALEEEKEQLKKEAVVYSLQDFIKNIEDSTRASYYPTGFSTLDSVIDGGLYAGLYIVGAISSLGKTTFCLQIADQVAQQGHDVLIFSLEMARNELIAKSVSRLTLLKDLEENQTTEHAKTTRGILTGTRYKNYSQTEKKLIQDAITAYGQYGVNIYITEGIGDVGINEIRDKVQKHINITGKAPMVVIDYLQIIAPSDIRASDKQNTDKAVLELKRLSRDYNIPVIGISSFNRDNYTAPVNLASFKESGAIEYSSDVLIGLQYEGMDYQEGESEAVRNKRIRELLQKAERQGRNGEAQNIQVKILKNRNGSRGDTVLDFYPMFNYFKDK